jgi:hypothetical protein
MQSTAHAAQPQQPGSALSTGFMLLQQQDAACGMRDAQVSGWGAPCHDKANWCPAVPDHMCAPLACSCFTRGPGQRQCHSGRATRSTRPSPGSRCSGLWHRLASAASAVTGRCHCSPAHPSRRRCRCSCRPAAARPSRAARPRRAVHHSQAATSQARPSSAATRWTWTARASCRCGSTACRRRHHQQLSWSSPRLRSSSSVGSSGSTACPPCGCRRRLRSATTIGTTARWGCQCLCQSGESRQARRTLLPAVFTSGSRLLAIK